MARSGSSPRPYLVQTDKPHSPKDCELRTAYLYGVCSVGVSLYGQIYFYCSFSFLHLRMHLRGSQPQSPQRFPRRGPRYIESDSGPSHCCRVTGLFHDMQYLMCCAHYARLISLRSCSCRCLPSGCVDIFATHLQLSFLRPIISLDLDGERSARVQTKTGS